LGPPYPTHLARNERFSGRTPFLFVERGLALSWYSRDPLFKPIEFVKPAAISHLDRLRLLADRNVVMLRLGSRLGRIRRRMLNGL
jgi:hypothetical protein